MKYCSLVHGSFDYRSRRCAAGDEAWSKRGLYVRNRYFQKLLAELEITNRNMRGDGYRDVLFVDYLLQKADLRLGEAKTRGYSELHIPQTRGLPR